ncbi:MAG: MmgE/PrpD family protein [Gammaproteobacteria bacterium]|nr:MmgE/PrpD family protein [Gammaproteobacteria bacterium]
MELEHEHYTRELAEWVVDTDFDQLPAEAIKIGKERLLDMIGVSLVGARDPDSAGIRAIKVVRDMGGRPVATVLGAGFQTNAVDAAFANGASAAALDVCDTTTVPLCHLSSCLVPAVLSVTEQENASGRDLIEAFVLAYESAVRVGSSMSGAQYFVRGFHSCGTWACFGTTAGAAKLLDLNADQLRNAWGIVASAASGLRTAYGTMTKPLHSAYSARNGVMAALLAREGFTGPMSVLERDPKARQTAHRYFSFPTIFDSVESVDLSVLTDQLGKLWHLVSHPPTEKFHPGVAGTYIDLAIDLRQAHNIDPSRIKRIDYWSSPANLDCHAQFDDPKESDAARYSIRYAIAAAFLDGEVDIKQHRVERIFKDDIQAMIRRVQAHEIPNAHLEIYSRGDISNIYADARIEVLMEDGSVHSGTRDKARGDWRLPLIREELLTKYRTCAREALSGEDVERSIRMLEDLENQSDLRSLMRTIAGRA